MISMTRCCKTLISAYKFSTIVGKKKKSLLLIKLEQLPRGSVKYPSLEKLKTQLYKVLRHLT